MSEQPMSLVERLNLLGIVCDEVPTDRLSSAIATLSCFPMYMVANLHGWTSDTQWTMPLVDMPGFEAIREAFVIGRQEKKLEMSVEHRRLLGTLLGNVKPSDHVIYEYALDSLRLFLGQAEDSVANEVRSAVGRMIIAVAKASGDGLMGTGQKISREEERAIKRIADRLELQKSEDAQSALRELD